MAGVGALEAELETAGGRFAYLQQLRAYIADLCDMLQARHHTFGGLVAPF